MVSLLTAFGLEDLVLLVTGYTLGKNPSDLDPDDPRGHFARDQSCVNALPKLAGLAPGRVDVAVMDGNHEPAYLRRELAEIRTLLRPGGLLILDDVFDWRSLAPVAAELDDSPGQVCSPATTGLGSGSSPSPVGAARRRMYTGAVSGMEHFWDARAREDAFYFVDSRLSTPLRTRRPSGREAKQALPISSAPSGRR